MAEQETQIDREVLKVLCPGDDIGKRGNTLVGFSLISSMVLGEGKIDWERLFKLCSSSWERNDDVIADIFLMAFLQCPWEGDKFADIVRKCVQPIEEFGVERPRERGLVMGATIAFLRALGYDCSFHPQKETLRDAAPPVLVDIIFSVCNVYSNVKPKAFAGKISGPIRDMIGSSPISSSREQRDGLSIVLRALDLLFDRIKKEEAEGEDKKVVFSNLGGEVMTQLTHALVGIMDGRMQADVFLSFFTERRTEESRVLPARHAFYESISRLREVARVRRLM